MASSMHDIQFHQMMKLQTESETLQIDQSRKIDEIQEELKSIKSRVTLRPRVHDSGFMDLGEIDALRDQLSGLRISQTSLAREQVVLKSLDFSSRPVRYRSIPEAHQRTFQWVFQLSPRADAAPTATKLGHWLARGDGIFWTSGKPGSGKSTFMKFVANHQMTRSLVSHWGASKPVAISSHYFWAAGTDLQKSIEGLLRSLVHDFYRQCPEIREVVSGLLSPPGDQSDVPTWSESSLQKVLREVAKREELSVKFCLFIDGLDEYDGDHFELCQILKALSESTDIKICASSRPWTVFEEALGDDNERKIYMQHLTRDDILHYTWDQMNKHPRWSSIITADPVQGNWLVQEVGRRADGVFLWVFLVVKRLRESLTNRDRVYDLRRRLESLPVELEMFFKHILNAVDSFYHDKMAITLQAAITAKEILPAIALDFLEQEYDDSEYVLKLPIKPLTFAEEDELKEQAAWWLNSRTKGLLEMDEATGNIMFLHRTVRDFLQTREMAQYISSKIPARFNITASLVKVFIAIIKRRQFDTPVSSGLAAVSSANRCALQSWISAAFSCANSEKIGGSSSPESFKLIEELDRTLTEMFDRQQAFFAGSREGHSRAMYFRLQLFISGVSGFLATKLPLDPDYFSSLGHLPIPLMMTKTSAWGNLDINHPGDTNHPENYLRYFEWHFNPRGLATLEIALKTQNLDPNAYGSMNGHSMSPWAWVVDKMIIGRGPKSKMSDEEFWDLVNSDIISLLLSRGAFAGALVENPRSLYGGSAAFYPVFLIYMVRAWIAPPPLPLHEQKYLRDLEVFIKHRNPIKDDFARAASDYLNFVMSEAQEQLALRRGLVVGSIASVLGVLARDTQCAPSEMRNSLNEMLDVTEIILPSEIVEDLRDRFSKDLDNRSVTKKKRAGTSSDSGSDPEVLRVKRKKR